MPEEKLSAYAIVWLAFVPAQGRAAVNVVDQVAILGNTARTRIGVDVVMRYFATKKQAQAVIQGLQGKLSKAYTVYEFTDKQFGMIKAGNFMAVLTTKQKEAAITIGGRHAKPRE